MMIVVSIIFPDEFTLDEDLTYDPTLDDPDNEEEEEK